MLQVSISEGEYILIGDNIKVHFDHKVNQNTLDIAVEAPKEITVLRGKLHDAKISATQRRPLNAASNAI
ncbi:MAG: carbon storage regulator [Defluviitaleaceae bacterium]|nr:carbon storage regulator [Defluviitaleaceae bacterium]